MSHSSRLPFRHLTRCSILALLLAFSASGCRSSDDDPPPEPAGDPGPDPAPGGNETETFAVGGAVVGMSGTALEISNNGSDTLLIDADGAFVFAVELEDGAAYDVQVTAQPQNPENLCTVANGNGTIGGADVSTVGILCTGPLALTDATPGMATRTSRERSHRCLNFQPTLTRPRLLPARSALRTDPRTSTSQSTSAAAN